MVLGELARTDAHNHRPVAGDSDQAESVKVLARAHQSLMDPAAPNEPAALYAPGFYRGALTCFEELHSGVDLAVLALAPTPVPGRALSPSKIAAALRRGARQRWVEEHRGNTGRSALNRHDRAESSYRAAATLCGTSADREVRRGRRRSRSCRPATALVSSATARVGAPDVRFLVMPDIMRQLPALVFLAAGFGLGYRRWIRPRRDHIDRRSLSLLLLLILASMAGFIGSPFWWFDVRQSFAWDLPPLASRMLAAAGVSLTVGAVLALERPRRQRVRLYLILLVAYMVPLVVVVAFHLDRFDFSAPITYGFFAAVAAVTIPSVLFLCRQPQIIAEEQPDDRGVTTGERTWLSVCAAAAGLWGIALLVTDDGPLEMIWVWPGDLLSSRLIAVMLLALAAGCLYSAMAPDVVPMMLLVIAVYGAMVSLATAVNLLSDKPVKPAYVVAFTALALGSVVILGRSSRGRRSAEVLQ